MGTNYFGYFGRDTHIFVIARIIHTSATAQYTHLLILFYFTFFLNVQVEIQSIQLDFSIILDYFSTNG